MELRTGWGKGWGAQRVDSLSVCTARYVASLRKCDMQMNFDYVNVNGLPLGFSTSTRNPEGTLIDTSCEEKCCCLHCMGGHAGEVLFFTPDLKRPT
jgi:hypothetical protein